MKPLRVGLILDGSGGDKQARALLAWGAGRKDLEFVLIAGQPKREPRLLRLLTVLERPLLRGPHREAGASLDLGPAASASENVDLLLSLGAPVPAGSARLGALRLRIPDGFWECRREEPRTSFVVAGPGGEVFARGAFRTDYCRARTQAHARALARPCLQDLLARIAASGRLPLPLDAVTPGDESSPGPLAVAGYGLQVLGRLARRALKLVGLRERWGISFAPASWSDADLTSAVPAVLPPGRMWADPFLVHEKGRTYCFVEDLSFVENKGKITALELEGTRPRELGVALEEKFHLSFPFIFRHEGALYMCPETSAARQIRVYRCASFPLKWELRAVLMDGVSAVDTVLFEREGRWWLLTNIDRSGARDFNAELFLYFAASPFDASWTPHPMNPLRVDSDGGRNGGLILEGGRIFRVGQRQGFDSYGGLGVAVYEIVTLTETEYREELAKVFSPSFRAGLLGAHHLSSSEGLTVVDHAESSWRP